MLTEKQREQTAARQQRFRERQQEVRRAEQAAKGLPALPSIVTIPGHPRWQAALLSAQALVTQVQEEMAAYYDARSEAWQQSDSGTEFQERQEAVEAVLAGLTELTP
ncbi:MAG: hypothetical protein JWN14_4026 [Chthonomonadales bacterium]|nr:hypothetical protein [Chthonomonadales bacterium]